MLRYLPVRKVHARQVLDSRGNPTVEAEVTVGEGIIGINGFTGRAMVPSGASTGKFEAVELRDGNREEYLGQSVKKAVENINTRLADAIIGENALNQAWIDHLLIETDGTENKSSAGANATLIPGYLEDEITMLDISEVECFSVESDKTYAIYADGKNYHIKKRLYELEAILPGDFEKINKSAIANWKKISRFKVQLSGAVDAVFQSGYTDCISRRCFSDLKRRYGL